MSGEFGWGYDAGNAWIPRDGDNDTGEGALIKGGGIGDWMPSSALAIAIAVALVILVLYFIMRAGEKKEAIYGWPRTELCERADVPRSVYYMLQERFRPDGVVW